MRWVRACVLALGQLAVSTSGAAGQTNTAELSGVVRDPHGALLPDASIVAVHLETRTTVERRADRDGGYRLAGLAVGAYTVTVSHPGFATRTWPQVTLELGQHLQLDAVLELAAIAEDVTVSVRPTVLQLTGAEVSAVVARQTLEQVPLNGRNVLALAQLSDAVILPPGGTRGDALQQAGPLPNVGGQRSGHNIYLLDGVKVTDELFNNLVINPSVDAVQEFKIQKSQYAAEFGGKASALINVATRAGTNALRGSLFGFGRHEGLDARGYFDPAEQPTPLLRQQQFGATAGGPIVQGRTFFFASYEQQRTSRGQTRTFSVPSLAARDGDLGSLRIDPAHIDPIARALIDRVPLPNRPGEVQNLVAVGTQRRRSHQASARVDQRVGASHHLLGRWSSFDADEEQPFGTGVLQESLLPGFGRRVDTRARNVGISYLHALGPRTLNEVRVGWLSVRGGQANRNAGVDFASQAGLAGVSADPRDRGYPQVSTRGVYATLGDPASTVARDNAHVELYENLLLDRGRHRIKTGGYLFHLRFRPEQPDNARGVFTYSGQFSGHPFGDFLLGYPASAVSGVGRGDEDGRTTWVHAFAQDDWRVRDNLTLNLGLRYEYNQHMRDTRNHLSSVDLDPASPRFVIASDERGNLSPAATAGLARLPLPWVSSAQAGWDRGLLSPSYVRLAPRTGFALALGDGRTAVRGGYGIFLNQWAYSVQTAFARNLPFFYARQVDVPAAQTTPVARTGDILATDATGIVSPTIMDHAYAVEYTHTLTGGVQHDVGGGLMLEAAYMGSWTRGADNATVRNVPAPGPGAVQARRPVPELGPVRAIRFDGRSTYHALTLRAERRLHDNHSFMASYTLSSSVDDASSPGATAAETNVPQDVANVFGPGGEWARSSFDHRHVVTANATWLLPAPAPGSSMRALLSGWRLTTVFFAQSGAPFTVNLGVDRANVGSGPSQRPDQLRDPNLPSGERRPERWFDTSAFAMPALYSFGTAPRNSVVGPGYVNVDLALGRTLAIGASRRVDVRGEVFNLLNRTNLDLPNRIFGTPNFGRIFSALPPRQIQLGVRLSF